MMSAAHCVLSGAVHESCPQRSLPPAIEFAKLGCAGIQIGLEVGVRLCSQRQRANSLRLLQGRVTLDTAEKSFMENVVRAAQGRGRVPSPGGDTWECVDMLEFGSSWDSYCRPFPNLKDLVWVETLLGCAVGYRGRL